MTRPQSVIDFGLVPPEGPLRSLMDILLALFGKVVSLAVVTMLMEINGTTATNAPADPGTALTTTRTTIDFQDAGVDSVRIIVRGRNSAVGSVLVQLYNVTTSAAILTATITNNTEQTADSGWTTIIPNGGDEEVEIRVIGDGAFDPILYGVQLHMRTVQARA